MVESFTVSAEAAEGMFFDTGSVTTVTSEIVGTDAKTGGYTTNGAVTTVEDVGDGEAPGSMESEGWLGGGPWFGLVWYLTLELSACMQPPELTKIPARGVWW